MTDAGYMLVNPGTLTVTVNSNPVVITAESKTKTYDGLPLEAQNYDWTGLPDGLVVWASVSGSQTDVGESASVLSESIEIHEDGDEKHDVKAYFSNITFVNGTLTVTTIDNEITLTADSQSKVYDGQELRCNVTLEGTVPDGYAWKAYTSWEDTTCYNSTALVFYNFYTAAGLDVTSYFTNVTTVPGSLTIEPLQIRIDLNGIDAPTCTFLNGSHKDESIEFSSGMPGGYSDMTGYDRIYSISLYTGDTIEITITDDQAMFTVPMNRDCYDISGDGLIEYKTTPAG